MVGLSVYLSTHKSFNQYPLYRTMEGLSMHLLTHKAIELYTLYRALVSLTVRNQSLYSTNYILYKVQIKIKLTNNMVR